MSAWPIRILHLGLGRFHRAHQAMYYQSLFEDHGEKWGVVSFSMQSVDARDQMRLVHNHYPVACFSTDSAELRWIESIRATYCLKDDEAQFLVAFANPDIVLVTLTVTEKAYLTPGLFASLYAGLNARRATGKSITILSCDNLQENGRKIEIGVLNFAEETGDPEMATWIEMNVTFPNCMVDRIVPALKPERIAELQAQFDVDSTQILATESFTQWVIEDRFAGARPPLEKVGAQFVSDIRPYEEMKLRLLNASHSLIAYAGILKGYRFVHEAIRDHEIKDRVLSLQSEVRTLLDSDAVVDLEAYCGSVLKRFDNEQLPHHLKQIAMDGSVKLKQRVSPSLRTARQLRTSHVALLGLIESWVTYCFSNQPDDPLCESIEALKLLHPDFETFKMKLLELASF